MKSPKTKRTKSTGLANAIDFEVAVNRVAYIETEILQLESSRDHAIQQLQDESAAMIADLRAEQKGKLALCEKFADEHRTELLPDKIKSASTALSTWGFRTGNRTVKIISKQIDEATIIATLKANGLASYVRQIEELAKDKILTDAVTDEKAGGVVLKSSRGALVVLAHVGLKIHQGETFYVEPKVDTASAVTGGAS